MEDMLLTCREMEARSLQWLAWPVLLCEIFQLLHMAGVQNSRSQGLYAVRRVGIEKFILHFGYEAGRN